MSMSSSAKYQTDIEIEIITIFYSLEIKTDAMLFRIHNEYREALTSSVRHRFSFSRNHFIFMRQSVITSNKNETIFFYCIFISSLTISSLHNYRSPNCTMYNCLSRKHLLTIDVANVQSKKCEIKTESSGKESDNSNYNVR